MGMSLTSCTHSVRLGERAKELEKSDPDNVHEAFDMTSTAGYDNDGSTGPELVDNGVSLGWLCRDYHKDAEVFWAIGDTEHGFGSATCYYQYGLNEDDALSRLEKALEGTKERKQS